jgi:hypothetical protein
MYHSDIPLLKKNHADIHSGTNQTYVAPVAETLTWNRRRSKQTIEIHLSRKPIVVLPEFLRGFGRY